MIEETTINIVVFDTDFLISNTNSLNEIIKKISTKYVCYIPQICIEEICMYKCNNTISKIRKFKNELKVYEKLGISFGMEESECKAKIIRDITKSLKKKFSNKIIETKDYKLSEILNRAYEKIPPFDESDKGLKDTLILLNIIDFIGEKNLEKIKFITNDKDFLKENVKESIINEVFDKTNCIMEIIDGKNAIGKLYNYLKIEEEKEEVITKQKENTTADMCELRQKINDVTDKIFYYEVGFGYNTYYKNTFTIFEKLTKEDVEEFISNIPVVLKNNIFSKDLKISEFFNGNISFCEETKISITNFEDLIAIYNSIKGNLEYELAFINFLESKFNENYRDPEADLPF